MSGRGKCVECKSAYGVYREGLKKILCPTCFAKRIRYLMSH